MPSNRIKKKLIVCVSVTIMLILWFQLSSHLNQSSSIIRNENKQKFIFKDVKPTLRYTTTQLTQRQDLFNLTRKDNTFLDGIPNKHCEDGTSLGSYEIDCLIGYGHFGFAFRVNRIIKGTNTKCSSVVKVQKNSEIKDHLHMLRNELEIMRSIQHPFLLSSECVYKDSKFIYIFTEPMMPFQPFLEGKGVLSVEEIKFYIAELILAVEYLHSKDITHLDILIKNLLLDNDGHIVLADFGISNIKTYDHIYQNSTSNNWNRGLSFVDQLNLDFAQIGGILTHLLQAYKGIEKCKNYGCKLFDNYKAKLKHARSYRKVSRKLKPHLLNVEGVYLTDIYAPNYTKVTKENRHVFKNIYGRTIQFEYTQHGLIIPESVISVLDIFNRHQVESLGNPKEKTAEKYFLLLKNSSFFSDINWQSVYERKVRPPFNGYAVRSVSTNNQTTFGIKSKMRDWILTIRQMYNHAFPIESCTFIDQEIDQNCISDRNFQMKDGGITHTNNVYI